MRVVLVLVTALALAGCATGQPEPVAEATTATVTVLDTPAPTTVTESHTVTTMSSASESASASSAPAPLPYDAQPGDTVRIRGEAATVCVNGDGYALNVVAAGANTSCEFSVATLDALTRGLNPTYDNVREHLPRTVTAHSPVTGQDYEMTCRQEEGFLLTCTGGQDARVWMY